MVLCITSQLFKICFANICAPRSEVSSGSWNDKDTIMSSRLKSKIIERPIEQELWNTEHWKTKMYTQQWRKALLLEITQRHLATHISKKKNQLIASKTEMPDGQFDQVAALLKHFHSHLHGPLVLARSPLLALRCCQRTYIRNSLTICTVAPINGYKNCLLGHPLFSFHFYSYNFL